MAGAWPTKPVRLLVGFAPGGSADMAGRLLAEGPPAEVLSRQDVIDAYLGTSEE